MSVQSQLNLKVSRSEDPQLDLFPKGEEIQINLFLDLGPKLNLACWRRRALFLTSVFLHILLILFIIYAPDLLRRGKLMMGIPVTARQNPQVSTLFIPPDLLKSLRQPPPEARPSDKNRQAQGKSPIIDPNGIHAPYSRGNTPEPEMHRGEPPSPSAAAPTPPPGGPPAPPQPEPSAPKPEPQTDTGLRLDDVTPQGAGGPSKFRMPSMTPGRPSSRLEPPPRGGYAIIPSVGEAGGGGDSEHNVSLAQQSTPELFHRSPHDPIGHAGSGLRPLPGAHRLHCPAQLASVIPESARLGEKGRVGVVFEILKDGSVPQLRIGGFLRARSLDRAAVNGIHSSVPFPPLPQEFTGNHLVLQFIFLYNIAPQ